jgi:O-antigen/teichoic acid export membrane protein
MVQSIKSKTISGMIWSAVQKFGNMGISFVSNIVLARMLTPDDYGCIGMLAIFIVVSNTFVDGGFGSALIQKKEPTQKDYSTIFWWNIFVSSVLYGVLYLSAPFIADFYHMPLLSSVLRVQGIILIINSLNIIQTNQLRKQLKFKRLANVTIIAHIIAAVFAIILAWKGFGVWALVAQQILASFIISVLLWILNKWMPDFCFSKESFKQLFSFGSFILISNLINTFCNNIQGLLIGRFFTPAAMGYYTQAHKLENLASHTFTTIIEQVSYPVLSKFQNDTDTLKSVLYKLVSVLVYISFPLMFVLILLAEPLIFFLYGEKWMASISYFQILCVAGMSATFHGVHYYAVASKGKSKELFVATIIKRILALVILVIFMYLGDVKGLICGVAIGAWVIAFINMWLVDKHINYTLNQQFKDILPIVLLSVATFFLVYEIGNFIVCNLLVKSLIIFCLYIFIYLIGSIIFKSNAFFLLREILINYYKIGR